MRKQAWGGLNSLPKVTYPTREPGSIMQVSVNPEIRKPWPSG